jgi:hypothetical protein
VPFGKDAGKQEVYFPRNLLMDRNSFFFPGASSRSLPVPPDEAHKSFG